MEDTFDTVMNLHRQLNAMHATLSKLYDNSTNRDERFTLLDARISVVVAMGQLGTVLEANRKADR